MKSLWILGIALMLLSCKNKTIESDLTNTDIQQENASQEEYSYGNQPMDPRGQNYFCLTGRPGLSAEYMQIALNETDTGIEGMWYFNSEMEEPVRQVIHTQSYDMDKNVLTGTYSYPGENSVVSFVLKGKRFTSTSDVMVDHYELEE